MRLILHLHGLFSYPLLIVAKQLKYFTFGILSKTRVVDPPFICGRSGNQISTDKAGEAECFNDRIWIFFQMSSHKSAQFVKGFLVLTMTIFPCRLKARR